MPTMNIIEAVNSALTVAMEQDDRVVVLGEDVGKFGGVFRATKGLYEKFGADRSIDTPLAEGRHHRMRDRPRAQWGPTRRRDPILRLHLSRLRSDRQRAGEVPLPVRGTVSRCPSSFAPRSAVGIKGGHYHSQSPEAYFIHTPGPQSSEPRDPLRRQGPAAERHPGRRSGDVPRTQARVPRRQRGGARGRLCDSARCQGEGRQSYGQDVTVVAWGAMLHEAKTACQEAAKEGVDCELIDLRTLLAFGHRSDRRIGDQDGSLRRCARGPQNLRVRGRAR